MSSLLRRDIHTVPSEQDGKFYCLVRVWAADDALYSVDGAYFIRTPKGSRPMTTGEVQRRYETIYRLREDASRYAGSIRDSELGKPPVSGRLPRREPA